MNRYTTQIVAALDGMQIVSPGRATWLGSPIPFATSLGVDDPSELAAGLAAILYRCFYATGGPEPLERVPEPATSPHDLARFVASLAAAAPRASTIEGGWRWVGGTRRRILIDREGLTLEAPRRVLVPGWGPDAFGAGRIAVLAPAVRLGIAPGYVTLLGAEAAEPPAEGPDVRFYWNVSARYAPPLMRRLAAALARRRVPYTLKALADPKAYARCDAAVLVVARADVARAAPILREFGRDGWWRRSEHVPAFSRPLAPGLATADAPPGGASYGESRCVLLAGAMVESFRRGERDLPERLERVARHFASQGVRIDRPYRAPGSLELRGIAVVRRARVSGPDRSASPRSLVGAAAVIARDLCGRAIGDGTACSWLDVDPDPQVSAGGRSGASMRILGPDLYEGTAGIGLFLAHWARRSGDERAAGTARRALRHALAAARRPERAPAGGFYAGWVGIAWGATEAGCLLGDAALLASARTLVRRRLEEPVAPGQSDLVAGRAGLLLGLLILSKRLGILEARPRAAALGRELLESGRRIDGLRSWRSPGPPTGGDLLGAAHGAAGIAHALLELHDATEDARFGMAATESIRYERRWFDASAGNWPDLRSPAVGVTPTRFMTAWCHGAVGIGLTRLHLWRRTGDETALAEARVSLRAARVALRDWSGDRVESHSLCHGLGGLALFLRKAETAGLPVCRRDRDAAAAGIGRCGAAEFWTGSTSWGSAAPGLFTGTAGVGFAALSLAGDRVSPILLPTSARWTLARECR